VFSRLFRDILDCRSKKGVFSIFFRCLQGFLEKFRVEGAKER